MKFAFALCAFALVSLSQATSRRRRENVLDTGRILGGKGCSARDNRGSIGIGGQSGGSRGSGSGSGSSSGSSGSKNQGGNGASLSLGGQSSGNGGSRSQGDNGFGIRFGGSNSGRGIELSLDGRFGSNAGSTSGSVSGSGSHGGNGSGVQLAGSNPGQSIGLGSGGRSGSGSNAGSGSSSQTGNAGANIGLGGGQGGRVAVGARSGSEVTNSGNVNGYQNNLDQSRTAANGFTDNAQASRGYDNSGSSFMNEANRAQSNRQFTLDGGFSDSSLTSSDRSSGSNFRNTGFDNSASQKAGFNFENDALRASQADFNADYFNQARNNAESFGMRMY